MKFPAATSLVGAPVVVGELDPFLDLVELGQLLEHVLLVAAKVGRRDVLAERHRKQPVRGPCEGRVQVADQRPELLEAVLDRRPGHEDGVGGPLQLGDRVLGALRIGVLDLVRLVDDDGVEVL